MRLNSLAFIPSRRSIFIFAWMFCNFAEPGHIVQQVQQLPIACCPGKMTLPKTRRLLLGDGNEERVLFKAFAVARENGDDAVPAICAADFRRVILKAVVFRRLRVSKSHNERRTLCVLEQNERKVRKVDNSLHSHFAEPFFLQLVSLIKEYFGGQQQAGASTAAEMPRRVLHELPRLLFRSPVRPWRISNYAVKLLRRRVGLKKITVQYGWIIFFAPPAVTITQEFGQHLATTFGQTCKVANVARIKLIKEGEVEAKTRNPTCGALDVHSAKLVMENFEQRVRTFAVAGIVAFKNPS